MSTQRKKWCFVLFVFVFLLLWAWTNRRLNEIDSKDGLNLINNDFFELTGRLRGPNSTNTNYANLGKTLELIKPSENDRNSKKAINIFVNDKILSRRVYETINAAAIAGFIRVKLCKKGTDEIVDYVIPSVCQDRSTNGKRNSIHKYFLSVPDTQIEDYKEIYDKGKIGVYIPIITNGKMYKHKGSNTTKKEIFKVINKSVRDSELVIITFYLDANFSGIVADWWAFGKFSEYSNVLFVLSHRK